MKKMLLLLTLISLLVACKNEKKTTPAVVAPVVKTDSSLITDTSWGLINNNTDIGALKKMFGENNIKDERVCGPECADSIDVTFVFRDQPNEFCINWQDSGYHKQISFIECWRENSPYHSSTGLKIGSTLNDILKLNRQKITFSGFGWDYGGIIQSYNKGTMENTPVQYRLDLSESTDNSLFGDTELNTDMPSVKKMLDKMLVYYIALSFHKAE
jgi:hypothetical protein